MTNTTTKKIIRIDASSLADAHCLRKLYYRTILGIKTFTTANDTLYGSAWHHFRETLAKTKDPHQSIGAGIKYFMDGMASGKVAAKKEKEWLNAAHLTQLCMRYLDSLPFGDFVYAEHEGKRMVEQTFSLTVYEDNDVIVYLQGTVDEIGKLGGSMNVIGDDKTMTAHWKYQPKTMLEKFSLRPQLRVYYWALREHGRLGKEGNFFETFFQQRVGCYINGIVLAPGLDKCVFLRSRLFVWSEGDITEFEVMMRDLIKRLVAHHDTEPLPEGKLNSTCSGNFGDCGYFAACNAPDDTARAAILHSHYESGDYTPLHFRKLSTP
jgi:hypothetical protein